jgi:hypothetical protein
MLHQACAEFVSLLIQAYSSYLLDYLITWSNGPFFNSSAALIPAFWFPTFNRSIFTEAGNIPVENGNPTIS